MRKIKSKDNDDAFQFQIDSEIANKSPKIVEIVSSHQLTYSIMGVFFGVLCILGGIVLFFSGIAGKTHWAVNLLGIESTITDASPGAILFIVGFLIIIITKYDAKIR